MVKHTADVEGLRVELQAPICGFTAVATVGNPSPAGRRSSSAGQTGMNTLRHHELRQCCGRRCHSRIRVTALRLLKAQALSREATLAEMPDPQADITTCFRVARREATPDANGPQSNGTLPSKGSTSRRSSATVATKSSVARGARSK